MKTLIFTVTSVPASLADGSDFAAVVGNIPELGSWEPEKGARSNSPSDGQYTATVQVSDDTHGLEFKWVFFFGDTVSWEVGLNKVVYDLPQTPGSVCHITNVLNGPAQTCHEQELPESNQNDGPKEEIEERKYNIENITRILNPQTWSRRQQILGIGIGLLLPICIAFKIMH